MGETPKPPSFTLGHVMRGQHCRNGGHILATDHSQATGHSLASGHCLGTGHRLATGHRLVTGHGLATGHKQPGTWSQPLNRSQHHNLSLLGSWPLPDIWSQLATGHSWQLVTHFIYPVGPLPITSRRFRVDISNIVGASGF